MKAKQIRLIYYYLELKFRRRDPYVEIQHLIRDMEMREEDVLLVVDSLIAARVIKKIYNPESPLPEIQMDMNFKGLRRMI
jgi:hypothetical protein